MGSASIGIERPPPMRWSSYALERGKTFGSFWATRLNNRAHGGPVLLICGLGFDPRTTSVLRALIDCCPKKLLHVILLHFDEGPDSISHQYADSVTQNGDAIAALVADHAGTVQHLTIPMLEDGRRVGGRRVGQLVLGAAIGRYDDVIVDISALPRTLYFPLIRSLLQHRDGPRRSGVRPSPLNLHVALLESPIVDSAIQEELTERADYLPGFNGTVDLEQDEDMPRVWSPVLGEGHRDALDLIFQKISVTENAPEICPVLPFPAINPRRGDKLLVEYRARLTAWQVDLRNIIYASEHNPFGVYRQLCRLYDQYSRALHPLRGAKMIVSAHSSKLLSLGALLAAYDRPEIAVAHVEAQGYRVGCDLRSTVSGELFEIWIAGEPYEA